MIRAFRMARKEADCTLVLLGNVATDDPEGEEVYRSLLSEREERIILISRQDTALVNALQRHAAVVVQKSLREGFGLTVAEGMWKGKPVIGGAAGGIPLQIVHGVTGFLVHSIEGCAFRMRQLLNNTEMAAGMGERAREFVRQNFLITRQVRDYLAVWYTLLTKKKSLVEL